MTDIYCFSWMRLITWLLAYEYMHGCPYTNEITCWWMTSYFGQFEVGNGDFRVRVVVKYLTEFGWMYEVINVQRSVVLILQKMCFMNTYCIWGTFFLRCLDMYVRQAIELRVVIPWKPNSSNYYTVPYRPNLPFLISDIRALWHSALSARVAKCQKLKMVG